MQSGRFKIGIREQQKRNPPAVLHGQPMDKRRPHGLDMGKGNIHNESQHETFPQQKSIYKQFTLLFCLFICTNLNTPINQFPVVGLSLFFEEIAVNFRNALRHTFEPTRP